MGSLPLRWYCFSGIIIGRVSGATQICVKRYENPNGTRRAEVVGPSYTDLSVVPRPVCVPERKNTDRLPSIPLRGGGEFRAEGFIFLFIFPPLYTVIAVTRTRTHAYRTHVVGCRAAVTDVYDFGKGGASLLDERARADRSGKGKP